MRTKGKQRKLSFLSRALKHDSSLPVAAVLSTEKTDRPSLLKGHSKRVFMTSIQLANSEVFYSRFQLTFH